MTVVKSFKMLTGEEVVSELVKTKETFFGDSNQTTFVLRRPHVLQLQPVGQGQIGLVFIPWSFSNPSIEEIDVPSSAVLIPPFDPDAKVERQYLEQTSGISLVGGGPASKFVKV